MNNEIASFLASGYSVDRLQAVRSHDNEKVWFISAHVLDPGGSVRYPTWAAKGLGNTERVYRGDAASLAVTPRMSRLPGFSGADGGVTAAQDCARKAAGGKP